MMNNNEIEFRRLARMRKRKRLTIVISLVLAAVALVLLAYFMCTVKKIDVRGNENYTDEQIIESVLPTALDRNTAYLYYKYHFTKPEEIPFLDMVEVEITGRDSVRITAYEKTIVGFAESQGSYVYFDKNGTVIDLSSEKSDKIPQIYGLKFDYIHMYEVLPVEKPEVFNTLYNLSQLMEKHDLHPNSITARQDVLEDACDWVLVFDQVEVRLGPDRYLENKVARLASLMNVLSGKRGVLHLEEVTEATENVVFDKVLISSDGTETASSSPEDSSVNSWNIDENGVMTPVEGQTDAGGSGISAEEGASGVISPDETGDGGSGVIYPDETGDDSSGVIYPDETGGDGSGVIYPDETGDGGSGVIYPDEAGDGGSGVIYPDE